MESAVDFSDFIQKVQARSVTLNKSAFPVVVIIGRPHSKVMKEDILPNLAEWNQRSADYIGIYCLEAGDAPAPGSSASVPTALGFDGARYAKAIESFEANTSWRYSGETDFLLLTAIHDFQANTTFLDFSSVVNITLERALDEKVIVSVPRFIEEILQFARKHEGKDIAFAFSDNMGARSFGKVLRDIVIAVLPAPFKDMVKDSRQSFNGAIKWQVRDFSAHEMQQIAETHTPAEIAQVKANLMPEAALQLEQAVAVVAASQPITPSPVTNTPQPAVPKVFISYTHDNEGHKQKVLDLADRLIQKGVDCEIDEYDPIKGGGLQRWMMNKMDWADYVLLVCTEGYYDKFMGHKAGGAKFEADMVLDYLYANLENTKFMAVGFLPFDQNAFIPTMLKRWPYYDVSNDPGFVQLYRRVTNQPEIIKPKLGTIERMPPRNHP